MTHDVVIKDINGRALSDRPVIGDIRDEVVEMEYAPWYVCGICGHIYHIDGSIQDRMARGNDYRRYVKRIVKKSVVMHVSSHLVYKDQGVLVPDTGVAYDDAPIARGEEFYLVAGIKFLKCLNVATLYSIREDAADQILNESYRTDSLSGRYRDIVGRCDSIITKRYLLVETRCRSAPRRSKGRPTAAVPTERKGNSRTARRDQITPRTHLNNVPLKPWDDPESMFCDTEFLTKLIGKEPRKGDECRDGREK